MRGQVVYHLVPTSNHNRTIVPIFAPVVVYHLVPTSNHNALALALAMRKVVYHLVPTSNHNVGLEIHIDRELFIILFLHQTTTALPSSLAAVKLFIILFLHQTTTPMRPCTLYKSCLSSCSYIKPQHLRGKDGEKVVVYHLVPTSNHNKTYISPQIRNVVYHLVPTSNHNRIQRIIQSLYVVYHLVPTSNHNL